MNDTARFPPLTAELLDWAVLGAHGPTSQGLFADPGYRARLLVPGLCHAMISGGRLIGAGGLVPHWPGLAEGWWLITHLARRRDLVVAARWSRAQLERAQADPAFRRLEFRVIGDHPWSESFARALGFTRLATLRRWDPAGRDATIYERLTDG